MTCSFFRRPDVSAALLVRTAACAVSQLVLLAVIVLATGSSRDDVVGGDRRVGTPNAASLSSDTQLNLTAHFLARRARSLSVGLEPLAVTALTVRTVGLSADDTPLADDLELTTTTTPTRSHALRRDGWSFLSLDDDVKALVDSVASICLSPSPSPTRGRNGGTATECVRSALRRLESSSLAEGALGSVRSRLADAAVSGRPSSTVASAVRCNPPAEWVVFVRRPSQPQNMHYDSVAAERTADCRRALRPDGDVMHVRVWLPLEEVNDAPLIFANTTRLYDDACPKRAAVGASADESLMPWMGTGGGRPWQPAVEAEAGTSPSWKIYSRSDFLSDCATAARTHDGSGDGEPCKFYHTVGMMPGEGLAFRNGLVMHGTADHHRPGDDDGANAAAGGRGGGEEGKPRVTIAVDCVVSFAADRVDDVANFGADGNDATPKPRRNAYMGLKENL